MARFSSPDPKGLLHEVLRAVLSAAARVAMERVWRKLHPVPATEATLPKKPKAYRRYRRIR